MLTSALLNAIRDEARVRGEVERLVEIIIPANFRRLFQLRNTAQRSREMNRDKYTWAGRARGQKGEMTYVRVGYAEAVLALHLAGERGADGIHPGDERLHGGARRRRRQSAEILASPAGREQREDEEEEQHAWERVGRHGAS